MNKVELDKLEDSIRNASPLELASKLREAELYDKKETRTVVDEVYAEFNKQGDLVNEVVVPIFMSIADGLLESTAATRKLRKKGLTASRVVGECKSFSYDSLEASVMLPDGYTEWKNVREQTTSDFKQYGEQFRSVYSRAKYEDTAHLKAYKGEAFYSNGGCINATDEYTGKKNIYKDRKHLDFRRNVQKDKHANSSEVDHIVPLKKVFEQFKGNYALTDEDIKNIANQETNYALTSAKLNRGVGFSGQGVKNDRTNEEFIADQRRRKKEGRPNLGLSEETEENMIRMGKDAQKTLEKNANKAICANLTGRGTGNTADIWKKSSKNAATQAKDYMIGNIVMFLIKPLYYEISDIFRNGLKEGVNAETTREALKKRFGRVKDYVVANAVHFLGNSVKDFVMAFVSSLIEGIISLFVGIFRQVLKVVKEGVKILAQSGKVLFGKQSHQMSAAEKGDAIVKIIGGSVIAICGIGIEALLNKIGLPDPWSVILSTMLSGIASAIFMLVLDKIDLFSIKAEKRRKRIEEIFDARIKDIQDAEQTFDTAAIETMRQQKLQFVAIEKNINDAIEKDDISSINTGLFKLADFMNIDLGYRNQDEFVNKFDDMDIEL